MPCLYDNFLWFFANNLRIVFSISLMNGSWNNFSLGIVLSTSNFINFIVSLWLKKLSHPSESLFSCLVKPPKGSPFNLVTLELLIIFLADLRFDIVSSIHDFKEDLSSIDIVPKNTLHENPLINSFSEWLIFPELIKLVFIFFISSILFSISKRKLLIHCSISCFPYVGIVFLEFEVLIFLSNKKK